MLFNSLEFFCFFWIVIAGYFALPHSFRWPFLLIASCYFYMCFIPSYILILFLLIFIDYCAGIGLEQSHGVKRRWILSLSLISNLAILVYFKYGNFLGGNLSGLGNSSGLTPPYVPWNIVLPIGLSFHTFQSMSYTIEVYRGRQKAEKNIGIYALYVLFFPQLVAGPIERPQHLIPQLKENHSFEYQRVADGLKLMFWGLFKKVVIADQLKLFVDPVYASPSHYTGWPILLATYAFAFQIFCDFSGYSDMARGIAKVLGVKLVLNFNRPYHARSFSEFWKRWHIALSSWFRDYVYIPLGGNRVSLPRWHANIFIVFLLSGLWHGASWTFVFWGALHGFYLLASKWMKPLRISFPFWMERVIIFHFVVFAWIFFRANSLSDAFVIIRHLFDFEISNWNFLAGISSLSTLAAWGGVLGLELGYHLERVFRLRQKFNHLSWPIRFGFYIFALFVFLLLKNNDSQGFIYFQF